jgi:hypothetical protein
MPASQPEKGATFQLNQYPCRYPGRIRGFRIASLTIILARPMYAAQYPKLLYAFSAPASGNRAFRFHLGHPILPGTCVSVVSINTARVSRFNAYDDHARAPGRVDRARRSGRQELRWHTTILQRVKLSGMTVQWHAVT